MDSEWAMAPATDDEDGSERPHRSPSGAGTVDHEPALPPLPDGGLAQSMPSWLRASESAEAPPAAPSEARLELSSATPPMGMATPKRDGDITDTTQFLSDDDLPEWIRRLANPRSADGKVVRATATDAPSIPREEPRPVAKEPVFVSSSEGSRQRETKPRAETPSASAGPLPEPVVHKPDDAMTALPAASGYPGAPSQEVMEPELVTAAGAETDEETRWGRVGIALLLAVIVVAIVYLVVSAAA